jgi:hypothetical protein
MTSPPQSTTRKSPRPETLRESSAALLAESTLPSCRRRQPGGGCSHKKRSSVLPRLFVAGFNKDRYDGPVKTYRPTGFVIDKKTNARWGMQFIWPIKGDYRIIFRDDDYQLTVIGRVKRDYVWVMSRQPELSRDVFERLKGFVQSVGYDASKLQRVPHGNK